jgi:hypothetical protein
MAAKAEIDPDKAASMSLVMTAFSLAAVSGYCNSDARAISPSDLTRLNVGSRRSAVRVTSAQRIIEVPDKLFVFFRFCRHFLLPLYSFITWF